LHFEKTNSKNKIFPKKAIQLAVPFLSPIPCAIAVRYFFCRILISSPVEINNFNLEIKVSTQLMKAFDATQGKKFPDDTFYTVKMTWV